jgi:hypothetical protein
VKQTGRSLALATILMPVTIATAMGCGGSSKTVQAPTPAPSKEELAAVAEAREQKEAQTAWCAYLAELYKRAAHGAASWPRYEQCTEVTTMAAPKMLKHTAECSLEALKTFNGDPFTPEYAGMVSRCGAEAVDQMTVTESELAPYVATICGRMTTCGQADYGQCREQLSLHVGQHLERAIGAINSKGRAQLRACLKSVACEDITGQITGCLEPLMDGLLWLPG